MNEVERIETEIKKGNTDATRVVVVGHFPIAKFLEWEQDCNSQFGGLYWIKMYADHLKAGNSNENGQLWKRIEELELELKMLKDEPKKEEKQKGILNLNGQIIE